MGPLAVQVLVAFPLQRDVEEGELAHVVEAGAEAGRDVAQHLARVEVLAQVDRQVETVRRQPGTQRGVVLVGERLLAEAGTGVEELELDEAVDAALGLGEAARAAGRQHVQRGRGEVLLEPPHRRHRGDEVADVIEFHHQESA